MTEISSFANLSFFAVSKYHYTEPTICNFKNSPRPHFCMGLILEGKGSFEFQGKTIEIEAGDIIFIPVGSRYVSHWSGSPDVTYISMHFSFVHSTNFFKDKILNIQKISSVCSGEFENIFLRAFLEYERGVGCNFSSLACFFEVMSKITHRLVCENNKKYDDRIECVTKFIEKHYFENHTIEQLASIAHMSISYFHAMFKSITGTTPIEYRNSIRIRYAIVNLIQGNKTIETISDELGFESVTYFRRVFKKETGCTPSKYNKKHTAI